MAAALAGASRSLVASLDYEQTLTSVVGVAVPSLADWCVVRLAEPDGRLRRLQASARTPEQEEILDRLHALYPPDYDWRSHPAGDVLRSEEPKLTAEVTDSMLQAIAASPEQLELMRLLGYGSVWWCRSPPATGCSPFRSGWRTCSEGGSR